MKDHTSKKDKNMAKWKDNVLAILNGPLTDQQKVAQLKNFVKPDNRVRYVRQNYVLDSVETVMSNRRTGAVVNKQVWCGEGVSPVSYDRGAWFLIMNEDPYLVGYDEAKGLYAIYEKGGDRKYLVDIRGHAFLRPVRDTEGNIVRGTHRVERR